MEKIKHYDLAVIGSGPAGEKAAMQASKLRKKVVLIEKSSHIGGNALHTGTMPSKSLRQTVVYLELLKRRIHGIQISIPDNITVEELMYRKKLVIQEQENSFLKNIKKNNIDLIFGAPCFKSPTTIEIKKHDCDDPILIQADYSIIATGSRPDHPDWVDFQQENIYDSDSILNIKQPPKKLTVIGAGVIGCEYACIFAQMGIRVNLLARDRRILPFLDRELAEFLMYRMRHSRITLRLGEEVESVSKVDNNKIEVSLKSGKKLPCTHVLMATGRNSNSQELGIEDIGIRLGQRGLIAVNENYQTNQENIYAVGDVIGFPALASTAMLQARIAVLHAFGGLENEKMPTFLPFGIWTIPSIAMVGKNEEELTYEKIPFEIGIAHFNEIGRAKILGEDEGILKLLFDPNTLKLLGVHIIGAGAVEMIHLGQAVLYYEGDIRYFINSVFNNPTVDEAYRVAAFNGINRLSYDL